MPEPQNSEHEHRDSNRCEGFVGFAPERHLPVATLTLGVFAKAKNTARQGPPGVLEKLPIMTLQTGDPRASQGDSLERQLKCKEG